MEPLVPLLEALTLVGPLVAACLVYEVLRARYGWAG